MVSGKSVVIVTIAVCIVAFTSLLYVSYVDVVYPESEQVSFPDTIYKKTEGEIHDFYITISYHDNKIYEGAEFKVEVFDRHTKEPVEAANVSFMIPQIYLHTNQEGFVIFSAPDIQDKYLLHDNDTSRWFPLAIMKEGYYTYFNSIEVHLVP